MPLSIGNRWVFQQTSLDSVGRIISTGRDSLFIAQDTLINSERWWWIENIGPAQIIFYTNRTTGLWKTDGASPWLFLKYPGRPGDSWTTPGGPEHFSITSISTPVTVPSGTYTCYVYEFPRGPLYYAPGVGEVKVEEYDSTSTGVRYLTYKRELISYIIN